MSHESADVQPAPGASPREADFERRLRRNPRLLVLHHALMMTLFPMAVLTLFQRDHLGLDMLEVMLVQAAFGGALAVFEFPSGYLADRIGYRKTMILASGVSIVGWSIYSIAWDFASVVVAEMTMGLGLSLVSGTHSALLFESLANRGRQEEFARWFGRSRFFAQIAEGSAALVAGLLFALSVRLPFLLMVLVWIVNFAVACALVEPRYPGSVVDRPLAHVRSLVAFVARGAPRLRALFAVATVFGLASFVPVWLVALYARDAGVAVSWLGPIWAVANYCVALGSLASDRLGRRVGLANVLLCCTALIAGGYFGMGSTTLWWGFVFYFAFNLSRGLCAPLIAHAEQEAIPSGDRASLVSLRSLLFRSGFLVLGPLVGASIDRLGQHPVLLGLGLFFTTAGLASWALLVRSSPANADARLDPA